MEDNNSTNGGNGGNYVAIAKIRVWVSMVTILGAFLTASTWGIQSIAKDVAKTEVKQIAKQVEGVKDTVQKIKLEQAGFKKDIEYIKKNQEDSKKVQERILNKLDNLLRRD